MSHPRFEPIPINLQQVAELREFERQVREQMDAMFIRSRLPAHCILPTDGSRLVTSPDGKSCALLPPPTHPHPKADR